MPGQTAPTLGLAFLAGFLSFISPCVLPLVPAYVSYLGGRVTRQAKRELVYTGNISAPTYAPGTITIRVGTLLHGLFFVLGFSLVFVLFGLGVTIGLRLLGVSSFDLQNSIARVGGLIVILFGLHVMGVTGFLIRRLNAAAPPNSALETALARVQGVLYADTRKQVSPRNPYGYAGSALMGVVFAAGWTPCVGPIYGSILFVAQSGSVGSAAVLLTAYSLGLGLPFLLTALALDQVRGLLKRLQRHMRLIETVSGLFLIGMGYLLASNQLAEISGRFTWLSDFSYNVGECGTGLAQGKLPLGDMGACLQLGTDYKSLQAAPPAKAALLIDGQIVMVNVR